ncbi:MAG: DUF4105 domain-containing protein [Pirellulales bacterium]|nr:DUF4105 domain-containing protein [Pirellulales bacterium]
MADVARFQARWHGLGRLAAGLVVLATLSGCAADRGPIEGLAGWNGANFPQLDPSLTDPSLHPVTARLVPSNDRDWSPDQAVLATADIDGRAVRVKNIRNFRYHGEDRFTADYYDKTFDLDAIRSVDFLVVPFPEMPSMAHTMLSFGFEGDEYVGVSVEIRKEKGETYDPVKGLLGQYELMYVVADERDLIQLRTTQWHNDVHLYHTRATPEQARALFVDVMRRVNQLAAAPEFYNTLTNNCTTNIVGHINRLAPGRVPFDYRVLVAGQADELAYDLGLLDTNSTFDRAREQARVNYLAYLYHDRPDFSARIRQ